MLDVAANVVRSVSDLTQQAEGPEETMQTHVDEDDTAHAAQEVHEMEVTTQQQLQQLAQQLAATQPQLADALSRLLQSHDDQHAAVSIDEGEEAVCHERPELDRATTQHEPSTSGTEPMRVGVVLAPPQAPSATQLTNQQVARRIPCGARS